VVDGATRVVAKVELCWVDRTAIAKKNFESADVFVEQVEARLNAIQAGLKADADKMLAEHIRTDIKDYAAFREHFKQKADWLGKGPKVPAFVRAYWCGEEDSLAPLSDLGVTVRNIPFDQPGKPGVCVLTGKPAEKEVIFARAY
jgi:prolyl-tRNA synthetase